MPGIRPPARGFPNGDGWLPKQPESIGRPPQENNASVGDECVKNALVTHHPRVLRRHGQQRIGKAGSDEFLLERIEQQLGAPVDLRPAPQEKRAQLRRHERAVKLRIEIEIDAPTGHEETVAQVIEQKPPFRRTP